MKSFLNLCLCLGVFCVSSSDVLANDIEANHCICAEENGDIDVSCNFDTNNQCDLTIELSNIIVNED